MKTLKLDLLCDMLAYKRPAGSRTEEEFIHRYLDSVKGMQKDDIGNRYILIGQTCSMFTSHTDTMHRDGGKQKIVYDGCLESIFSDSEDCLGADDTTGIYIMLEMIKHKIPGLYCFFREEEVGGNGSYNFDLFELFPELYIKRCISFDRKGDNSVITEQVSSPCCSSEFANALCGQLKELDFMPDDTGTFTDSANFMDVIPECTNISVGYYNQHTQHEYQDVMFLDELMPSLLAIDWESLPTVRDPSILPACPSLSCYSYDMVRELVYNAPEEAIGFLCDYFEVEELY